MTDKDDNKSGDSGGGEDARIADLKVQLAKSQGDWERFATSLHSKNYHLRQRAREAEGRAPGENETIITADEATLLAAYKKLGTVSEIGKRESDLVKLQRFQMVSEAAGVAGMNPKVLNKLLPGDAKLEVGEATGEDGQAKRVVRVVREGESPVNVATYAETNWSDFLPALKAGGEEEGSGKEWISQSGTGKADAGGSNGLHPSVTARLERAKARSKERLVTSKKS